MSKRIITLGTWEGKPIEWLVLKEEGFATLVVSKNILFNHYFDSNVNRWDSSALRRYLNCEFYKQAFNENEKKKVINVQLTDVNTKDNIFVLSINEVENLMTYNETALSKNWYSRTSSNYGIYYHYANSSGWNDTLNSSLGIRPAMWIKEK